MRLATPKGNSLAAESFLRGELPVVQEHNHVVGNPGFYSKLIPTPAGVDVYWTNFIDDVGKKQSLSLDGSPISEVETIAQINTDISRLLPIGSPPGEVTSILTENGSQELQAHILSSETGEV